MIGHAEAFRYYFDNAQLHAVFVIVGDKPKDFDPISSYSANPSIYTEKRNPTKLDLAFLKDQTVHLIHGNNATDELFAKWFAHLSDVKPALMVATDSEKDLYVYKKH